MSRFNETKFNQWIEELKRLKVAEDAASFEFLDHLYQGEKSGIWIGCGKASFASVIAGIVDVRRYESFKEVGEDPNIGFEKIREVGLWWAMQMAKTPPDAKSLSEPTKLARVAMYEVGVDFAKRNGTKASERHALNQSKSIWVPPPQRRDVDEVKEDLEIKIRNLKTENRQLKAQLREANLKVQKLEKRLGKQAA